MYGKPPFMPCWEGFTPSREIPALYWNVKSQEQRIHRICQELCKLIEYASLLGIKVNINRDDINQLQRDFEKFKESGFLDYYEKQIQAWIDANMEAIMKRAARQVFFGLTDDGYFCAYVPASWDDIVFDTGAVFGRSDYGRLILRYDVDGNGVIDNTYSYSLNYRPATSEQVIADLESVTRRNDATFATLFTNLDDEVLANGNF